MWAVKVCNRFSADLESIAALISESRSKYVSIQREMPQLVDTSMLMISKQNIRYNQMTRGVEILRHNVYSHYTAFILESHIVEATVKEGISVIAANASQDYENLTNALNAQIRSNNSVWAKIATTLRERLDADNGLATQLEAQ
jgi:hypothetical protein